MDMWDAYLTATQICVPQAAIVYDKFHVSQNYILHPITNAATEGFNSKIQALRHAARGFRRFANYRARILFCCGKLALLP
jgi:transposase